MKIGEARQIYSAQLHEYWDQKLSLAKKKKELEEKSNAISNEKELFSNEAATLELSYNAVSEKYEEYNKFMEKIMDIHTGLFNAEVSKQQSDVMSEYSQDMGKIMEVARRISKGGKVPATDEQKLMEYSMQMYMSAKNMAMMNELKKKEEYDSLWDDEKDTRENLDSNEVADNAEVGLDAPDVVDVEDVMESAVNGDVLV
ncbi:MAG: hypothetical protein ACERKN_12690 [Velocimicrobium sp.]